ncbi:unnamed protein product [Alternaria burnsii]|nr:unnamed protein product [Alternaria burnsii]
MDTYLFAGLSIFRLVSTSVTLSLKADTNTGMSGTSSSLKRKSSVYDLKIHSSFDSTPTLLRRGAGPERAVVVGGALWYTRHKDVRYPSAANATSNRSAWIMQLIHTEHERPCFGGYSRQAVTLAIGFAQLR